MKKAFYYAVLVIAFFCLHQPLSAQIQNGGFESWTAGTPDGWWVDTTYTKQSTSAHSGTYAVELTSISFASGALFTGSDFAYNYVYCNCRPAELHFWYYHSDVNSESFNVTFNANKNSSPFGSGFKSINDSTLVYKEAIIPLTFYGAGNADSIAMTFGKNYPYKAGKSLFIDDVSFSESVTSVQEIAADAAIESIQPNPAYDKTSVIYSLPTSAKVSLDVYDVTGRKMRSVIDANQTPGRYKGIIETADMPAGNYFCRLTVAGMTTTKTLIVAK